MKLTLGGNEYDVSQLVAVMSSYKIYLCRDAKGSLMFLQIAREQSVAHDAVLDKSAYALRELKNCSDKLEELYREKYPGKSIGYDRMFPELVQCARTGGDQGQRMVNILSVKMHPKDATSIDKMIPLQKLLQDGLMVDEPTSAWIMGRFLKLFTFLATNDMSITIQPENVLLSDLEQYHNVVLVDWSGLEYGNGESWRQKLESAAKTTLAALGLQDGQDLPGFHSEYINFIVELTKSKGSGYSSPEDIHRDFYEIVHGIWGKDYIPMHISPKRI